MSRFESPGSFSRPLFPLRSTLATNIESYFNLWSRRKGLIAVTNSCWVHVREQNNNIWHCSHSILLASVAHVDSAGTSTHTLQQQGNNWIKKSAKTSFVMLQRLHEWRVRKETSLIDWLMCSFSTTKKTLSMSRTKKKQWWSCQLWQWWDAWEMLCKCFPHSEARSMFSPRVILATMKSKAPKPKAFGWTRHSPNLQQFLHLVQHNVSVWQCGEKEHHDVQRWWHFCEHCSVDPECFFQQHGDAMTKFCGMWATVHKWRQAKLMLCMHIAMNFFWQRFATFVWWNWDALTSETMHEMKQASNMNWTQTKQLWEALPKLNSEWHTQHSSASCCRLWPCTNLGHVAGAGGPVAEGGSFCIAASSSIPHASAPGACAGRRSRDVVDFIQRSRPGSLVWKAPHVVTCTWNLATLGQASWHVWVGARVPYVTTSNALASEEPRQGGESALIVGTQNDFWGFFLFFVEIVGMWLSVHQKWIKTWWDFVDHTVKTERKHGWQRSMSVCAITAHICFLLKSNLTDIQDHKPDA